MNEWTTPHKWSRAKHSLSNFMWFIPRLIFNILVISAGIGIEVAWISFLFGSVVGVVLVLIFMPGAFFAPLFLCYCTLKLWPEYKEGKIFTLDQFI